MSFSNIEPKTNSRSTVSITEFNITPDTQSVIYDTNLYKQSTALVVTTELTMKRKYSKKTHKVKIKTGGSSCYDHVQLHIQNIQQL